ncbi:uncharacterized protein LOC106154166 [Lingula anatina]|uniref:Uncharacterized protein LOC106154166 n=1 Tax=Lingula anatina TaxID=7574 RepID=A0A1S3HEG1_LINAN|nr:uncharacterized protein LOC106154166 [Lingula anatina]|eukprot:XP_013383891.1 uncharacterized protein LOC106154166 [Lingula anatina]
MPDYIQCWTDGVINSGRSSTWSAVLMSVLTKGELEWKQEHYSDLAFLLAHCEKVYSADVPTALQHLAAVLSKSSQSKEIADMTTEDAVKWLQNDKGEPGKKFAEFMARHGHRCVREAEMLERSWRQQPEKVVSVIQSMMKAGIPEVTKRSIMSVSDSLAGIKSPTTWFGRLILKWALPRARAAVGDREWGKSLSVQMTDVFKEAYWALAELMVKEGRLPEPDLLFFLTHQEIGTLLKTRSGRLVAKANRRKRVLPKQMATEFPEFSIGHPEPIEEVTENDSVVTSVALKGLPVSQGVVRGTARVVTSLQEASQIQPGDILIVPYTDVGWSPYFPLISGLVTELGGLLSHGAVVAREYGLPCVVNIPKATHLFATGDQVVLNGTKGTLEKME